MSRSADFCYRNLSSFFLFDPNYSHDVNELPVSLTSYANFVVKGFFSVSVVKEMQVLLTTHKSTNFSNFLFLLIRKCTEFYCRIFTAVFSNSLKLTVFFIQGWAK